MSLVLKYLEIIELCNFKWWLQQSFTLEASLNKTNLHYPDTEPTSGARALGIGFTTAPGSGLPVGQHYIIVNSCFYRGGEDPNKLYMYIYVYVITNHLLYHHPS